MKRSERIQSLVVSFALVFAGMLGARLVKIHTVKAAPEPVGIYMSNGAVLLTPNAGTTVANCPAAAGLAQLCVVASGIFTSTNGGGFIPLPTSAPTPVAINPLTINSKTCNLGTGPCSFAITANVTAPPVTSSAPIATVAVQ